MNRRLRASLPLIANLIYGGFHLLLSILNHTAWFAIFAVYYFILATMRILILPRMDRLREWRRTRLCAAILFLLHLILTAAVLMILFVGRSFHYPGLLIYCMATYSFAMVTRAIISFIRDQKFQNPRATTAKIIALAEALISMLPLETAMFSAFGAEMPLQQKQIFITATGAGLSLILLTLSIYMILRSNQEIKKEKHLMKPNQTPFAYTYSAKDHAEIKRIRDKYSSQKSELSKLEHLRRLDNSVTQKATVYSLIPGILGALILGTGMSLILTDLGSFMGTAASLIVGILLGVLGMIPIALAYPIYLRTVEKERERIAPEILRLTDELMQ